MLIVSLVELLDSSMMDKVLYFDFHFMIFQYSFVSLSKFKLYQLLLFLFSLLTVLTYVHLSSAIITGSSDRSILATDLETGSPIARLENAHE